MSSGETFGPGADVLFSQVERQRRADQLQHELRYIIHKSNERSDLEDITASRTLIKGRALLVNGSIAFITPPFPDVETPHPEYAPGITFEIDSMETEEQKPSLESVWNYVKHASSHPSQIQVEELWEQSTTALEYGALVYMPPNRHEEELAMARLPGEIAKLLSYHTTQPIGGQFIIEHIAPQEYLTQMAVNNFLLVRRAAYTEIAKKVTDPFCGRYPNGY